VVVLWPRGEPLRRFLGGSRRTGRGRGRDLRGQPRALLPNLQSTQGHEAPGEEFRTLLAREAAGVPDFTAEQVAYLQRSGIALPPLPRYGFFFEVIGAAVG
jgi:hypothetical protein